MKILADQLRVVAIDEQIEAWPPESAAAQALKAIPGVGALILDQRGSGRDFTAWLGFVPRQNSSGGKERLVSRP